MMTRVRNSQPSSRGKVYLFYFILLTLLSILFLITAEFVLRIKGFRPFEVHEVNIKVEPGGKFFTKHPTLGYTHLPGEFIVTLHDGYSFKVTHLSNTLRVTHPINTYNSGNVKDEIWIFGGSVAHGWSLNDNETYPWLLQKKLLQYEVVNFGVSGYGTLHSLIQFKEALKKRKKPRFVIIAYGSFHDERNTFLRSRRKMVAPWNKLGPLVQPYARINKDGALTYSMAKVEYKEFPFMSYSVLMHIFEKFYNKLEDRFYHSHEVSKAIIKEFSRLTNKNGIELIVAGIKQDSSTYDMLEYAKSEGVMAVDISVDLDIKENTNLPHDVHPSAIANIKYSQKLESFLKKMILKEKNGSNSNNGSHVSFLTSDSNRLIQ